MFTGIIEEVGKVESIKKGVNSSAITISGNIVFTDLNIGDSLAVNGVCLTVVNFSENRFVADVMHETINLSSLGSVKIGNCVNLERAMPNDGRFGGHIVSGHIDGIGEITKIEKDDNAIWYTIEASMDIMKYIIRKGSIAIDGISLTIARISEKDFGVSVIPHTIKNTNLLEKKAGDIVNLENDIIGKYVEKLMYPVNVEKQESKLTKEFLKKFGY